MEVKKENYDDLELYPIHKQLNKHNMISKNNHRTIIKLFGHKYSIDNTVLTIYKSVGAIIGIGITIIGSYVGYCAFWCR